METYLIDKNELEKKFPALMSKPYRLSYLIKSSQIPIVRIGRRIYFIESEIRRWIDENKISEIKNLDK